MSGGRNRGCGGGRRTALSAHGQIQRGAGGAGPEPWHGRGAAGARRGRGGAQRCWPRCSTGGGRTCERRGTGGEGTRATCPTAGGAVWVEGRRRRRAETARRLGRRAPADVRCLARQKGGARPGRESVSGVVRREARRARGRGAGGEPVALWWTRQDVQAELGRKRERTCRERSREREMSQTGTEEKKWKPPTAPATLGVCRPPLSVCLW